MPKTFKVPHYYVTKVGNQSINQASKQASKQASTSYAES
jgi:hypothetical protein